MNGPSTAADPARAGLFTADDVASLLQVPRSWGYAEARAGRIPHVTVGRYRRFRRETIEAWIEAAERGPEGGWQAANRKAYPTPREVSRLWY